MRTKMNKELLSKLTEMFLLSDKVSKDKKNYIASSIATAMSEDATLTLIHLALRDQQIPHVNVGDVVYAHIGASYKVKEFGDPDRLIESGMAFAFNNVLYYIGVVTGCDSYGDYNPYSINKKIKFYGLNDDMEYKIINESVSHADIITTNSDEINNLVNDNQFHTIVNKIEDIRADYHGLKENITPN